jgi:D-glycerate 3-kinase
MSSLDRSELAQLLQLVMAGQPPVDIAATLAQQILADEPRAIAFGISPDRGLPAATERLTWLRAVYPIVQQAWQRLRLPESDGLVAAWNLWLPLALALVKARQQLTRPLIQGILGGQGTGKTTLGALLTQILAQMGYRTLSWSIDDLYLTYAERQRLRDQDSRLIWRGPPGTHDVHLGIHVLDAIRAGQPTELPRFDKSLHQGAGDRTQSEPVDQVDILLFDGWFVGVRPIAPAQFDHAPAPIVTETDRAFARDMNQQLRRYLPLWERLDRLLVLYPVEYRLSKQWRKQAEQEMRVRGQSGMSDAEIEQFVDYFWKALHPELLIRPLVAEPGGADLVIEILANHQPGAVYQSGDRPPLEAV